MPDAHHPNPERSKSAPVGPPSSPGTGGTKPLEGRRRRGAKRPARRIALTAALVAAIGCTEGHTPTEPRPPASLGRTLGPETPQETVAEGIALALADDQLRDGVLKALQESPLNEHKLVLQDFVETRLGRRLLTEAAERLERRPGQLRQLVGTLPEMDFYVPYREQRLTWTGSPLVAVAAILDVDAEVAVAYTPAGRRLEVDEAAARAFEAFFILHPAEPKITLTRRATLSARPNTIEVAGELTPDHECPIPESIPSSSQPASSCGGGQGPHFITNQVEPHFDDGPFGGEVELSFRHFGGSEFHFWQVPGYQVTLDVRFFINGTTLPDHQLWEEDSWLLFGDDFMGNSLAVPGPAPNSLDVAYLGVAADCPNPSGREPRICAALRVVYLP